MAPSPTDTEDSLLLGMIAVAGAAVTEERPAPRMFKAIAAGDFTVPATGATGAFQCALSARSVSD